MNISNNIGNTQSSLSIKNSSVQKNAIENQKNVDNQANNSENVNEEVSLINQDGDSLEISDASKVAFSKLTQEGDTEGSTVKINASVNKSSVAPAAKSGTSSTETEDEDTDTDDLSSKTEIQLRQMVSDGEITRSEMNEELKRRSSEDSSEE